MFLWKLAYKLSATIVSLGMFRVEDNFVGLDRAICCPSAMTVLYFKCSQEWSYHHLVLFNVHQYLVCFPLPEPLTFSVAACEC